MSLETSGEPYQPRLLNVFESLALSFFWFTSNVFWVSFITVLVPEILRDLVSKEHSGTTLAVISAIGALLAAMIQPFMGALSDRSNSRLGRRRPFMLIATAVSVILFLFLGHSHSLAMFVVLYLLVQFSFTSAMAPYQALIPDLVAKQQRGTASGYLGLMSELAIIVGVLIPVHFSIEATLEILAVFQIIGLIVTFIGVREIPSSSASQFRFHEFFRGLWIPPKANRDWWLVFGTRLVMLVGFNMIQYYVLYYLAYATGAVHPKRAMQLVFLLVTLGAALSVLAAGWLSDRLRRRKPAVILGGLLMAVASLGFVLMHSLSVILVFSFIYGLGFGVYSSTDWALGIDVLPKRNSFGLDMGLWNTSSSLSMILSNAIGGLVLALLTGSIGLSGAYRSLYLVACLFFLLGSLFVAKVRQAD